MNCELSNMKMIKVPYVHLCVALLSLIIQGGKSMCVDDYGYHGTSIDEEYPNEALYDTQDKVNEIIASRGTINNVFKPLEFLGSGCMSVSYKGELVQSKKIVAMKISPISMMRDDTVDEYLMYTYMNAIDNETVENYGIPAVYYYCANWEGCMLLALTLLEPDFNRLIKTPKMRFKDLDVLIILREFVRATKYIHSCGVCHADLHLNNMMFRRNQGFIIDFNASEKVNFGVGPDSDCRKMDWRKFLVGLCPLYGFPIDSYPYTNTLKNIENMKNNNGLRLVLMNFVDYAFKSADPINYNQMYQMITQEINRRGVEEPALLSWLTDSQKNEAIAEGSKKLTAAFEKIVELKTHCIHPKPKLDQFDDFKKKLLIQ